MKANLRWHPMVGALPILLLSVTVWAKETQSKLAGSWALVEGVKEFAGEKQPLPGADRGRVYLVIKPSGHFYQAVHFPNGALDDLVNPGDRMDIVDGSHLEVAGSAYGPEASELVLALHDGPNNLDYRVSVEAKLLPDGNVSYRTVSPSYGGADLVVSATLRRIESERPWQPDGLIRGWRLHGSNSLSVDLSGEGRFVIAAGLTDKVVRVWDVETGKEIQRFVGHVNDVCAVAISADGRLAASGSRTKGIQSGSDDSIRVWDVETGKQLHRFEPFSEVARLEFTPDGKALFAAGSGPNKLTYGIWDLSSSRLRASVPGKYGARDAVLSADGRQVVVRFSADRSGCPLKLFDASTGSEALCFGKGLPLLDDFIFSPDGLRLLTSTQDGDVQEWSLETGESIRHLRVDSEWASCVAYLPDGKTILTASQSDNSIRVWDLESGEELMQFAGHRDDIHDLKVSSDGRIAVSCGDDSTVRVWRIPPAISERG